MDNKYLKILNKLEYNKEKYVSRLIDNKIIKCKMNNKIKSHNKHNAKSL